MGLDGALYDGHTDKDLMVAYEANAATILRAAKVLK